MSPNSQSYLNAAHKVISGGDSAMRKIIGAHANVRRYNERSDAEQRKMYDKLRQTSQVMAERLMRSGQVR